MSIKSSSMVFGTVVIVLAACMLTILTATTAMADPSAPFQLSGKAGTQHVDIQWYQPAEGSEGLTNYTVYRGSEPDEMERLTNVTANVTAYHDEDLVEGSTHYYYVTAWYNDTEGMPSNAVVLTTENGPEKDNLTSMGVVVAIVIAAIALQLGIVAIWVLVRKGSK